ncbi:hypothetical protein PHISCL_02749 [Aspergillus sclerotialis]|uniref:Uncharacterized protein n=1 Tax=Aspergillus sclerotialis TaxID=2070753 RepID=A0A3A2ZU54_9EURO|nr:hypothetical protein PHISCL_02749 [Aspergillus sclerotialis]
MPDIRRGLLSPRRGPLVSSFFGDLLHEIDQATCRKNRPSEKFVPYAALEAIWTESRLEEFVHLIHPGFDRDLIPFVRENLLRTLSILVSISWGLKEWELFGVIFLHRRNERGVRDRLDDRIPNYTLGALTEFLDPIYAGRFLSERWTFYPIVLEEGKTQHFSGDWRLPFVNEESIKIGSGGYGQVTKEVVAKRQFVVDSALPRSVYQVKWPQH